MANTLAYVFGGLAVAAGVLGSLTMLVFGMASLANSTPEQLRTGKQILWLIALGGLACAIGGVWLMVAARPWWGLAVGGLPAAACFVAMVWLTLK